MYFMTLCRPFLYIPTIKKKEKKEKKRGYKSKFTIVLCVNFFFIVNYYCFLITPSIIVYER